MIGRAVIAVGDPTKVDEGVAFVRDEVLPVVAGLPGSYGLGMWVNRQTGEIVVNTVWQDEAAEKASDVQLASLRAEALRRLGADGARIELFEPVVVWQSEPNEVGQWVRAVEVRHAPERLGEDLAGFRELTLPAIQAMRGVTGVVLLADRTTGLTVLNVTYRSREEFEESRERGATLRAEALARMGAELEKLTELQVAIVGIRAPIGSSAATELPAQGRAAEARAVADT